jgi:hypothetical protein
MIMGRRMTLHTHSILLALFLFSYINTVGSHPKRTFNTNSMFPSGRPLFSQKGNDLVHLSDFSQASATLPEQRRYQPSRRYKKLHTKSTRAVLCVDSGEQKSNEYAMFSFCQLSVPCVHTSDTRNHKQKARASTYWQQKGCIENCIVISFVSSC